MDQPAYACSDGTIRDYTSARLKTQGLFNQAYGRFEARIKIPAGQGMWPAFWMLGNNIGSVGWPKCGEIDIMENIGKEPGTIHGSLHGPSTVARTSDASAPFSLPAGQNFADAFHLYAVEWEPGTVRFYVDSNLYATFTQSQWPAGGTWVFDHPFFILLNAAVGGNAVRGSPDYFGIFPIGAKTRTPAQILAHRGDLFDWALTMAQGQQAWHDSTPLSWNSEIERFFAAVKKFDDYLASGEPLHGSAEGLFQGPVADALNHIGQIAMLRRLGASPIVGEN